MAHNRYNNTQALMFQDSTNLMEYNTSSASNILNTGTYSTITNSINCKNKEDDTTIVLNDIIKLNPTTDGYNNLSFGFKDGKVYSLEYILADTTTEIYLLNDKAAKTVTASMSYSTTPIIQESITNEWTYISLPSSSILCKDKNLSISCDQNNTLASVFTDQFTVYKYDQGWSFWDENSSVDQNANKFTSIDPREGVLIKNKSTISKTLNIPYNIFEKLYTKSFVPYTTGWFLINGRFNKTASQIESSVEVNDKKLQYILQFKEATWSVYAPDNDSTISHSLPRISNIDQASSFWIYMNK